MFSYVVRCVFARREALETFVAWLRDEHLAAVCAAGADAAELIVLDPGADAEHAALVRYRFASREAFVRYERDEAPRLREEGRAVAERVGGVTMTRTTGEIVASVVASVGEPGARR